MSNNIRGWILVYLIGSIPILMIYSMALSGWFFEYPFILMVSIFLVLSLPLLLIIIKYPKAPWWNKFMWRSVVILMTLRSISIFLEPNADKMTLDEIINLSLTLLSIVSISVIWLIVWTKYFNNSIRAKNTFLID
tara:strand:- start:63 stop:467 length:405 start_codon:yes stop_codon:yes gene_type:complete